MISLGWGADVPVDGSDKTSGVFDKPGMHHCGCNVYGDGDNYCTLKRHHRAMQYGMKGIFLVLNLGCNVHGSCFTMDGGESLMQIGMCQLW